MAAWRACRSRPLGHRRLPRLAGLPRDGRPPLQARRRPHGRLHARRAGRAPGRRPEEGRGLRAPTGRRRADRVVRLSHRVPRPADRRRPIHEHRRDTIGRGRGSLAIPRRILRFLAHGARPAMIATALGILLRCLSRRRAGFDGRGRVKAAWIARVFGVDPRRVKRPRARAGRPSAGSPPSPPTSGP